MPRITNPTLHLPPKPPGELQKFTGHFALALENRYDLTNDAAMTPSDVLKAVLDALDEARKEMGW
jgi:hypothetical protein